MAREIVTRCEYCGGNLYSDGSHETLDAAHHCDFVRASNDVATLRQRAEAAEAQRDACHVEIEKLRALVVTTIDGEARAREAERSNVAARLRAAEARARTWKACAKRMRDQDCDHLRQALTWHDELTEARTQLAAAEAIVGALPRCQVHWLDCDKQHDACERTATNRAHDYRRDAILCAEHAAEVNGQMGGYVVVDGDLDYAAALRAWERAK